MARPTKYEPERAQRILEALKAGNTRRASAGAGGIDEDTLTRWSRRYAGFAGQVQAAEAEAERFHVANIKASAEHTWKASSWWLERRRPDDWKQKTETALTNKDGEPLKVIVEYAGSPDPPAPAPSRTVPGEAGGEAL